MARWEGASRAEIGADGDHGQIQGSPPRCRATIVILKGIDAGEYRRKVMAVYLTDDEIPDFVIGNNAGDDGLSVVLSNP